MLCSLLNMYVRGFGIILLFIGTIIVNRKSSIHACNTFSMKDEVENEGEQEIS